MWNPNTNENVLGWKFVFGSNTLTSVIRQNPPCFKLFCQLWFQTSASAVFWGLGGKVKYEVVEVSTMFLYSPSLSFCGCLSPAFWLLFALSCHGFGEWNLFMLLLQELSQVASLEGLWREAPHRWDWAETPHRGIEKASHRWHWGEESHRWDWRCWAAEGLSALPALRLNRRSVTCKRIDHILTVVQEIGKW